MRWALFLSGFGTEDQKYISLRYPSFGMTIYEKSLQDQQKLAHIEDVVSDFDDDDIITDMDETDRDIRYGDVEFSDGYGVKETEYEEDEEE